jgi:hypothetical protein
VHVTEGSRGVIMPRRRPAPEGGGAAAPSSSRMRQSIQDEGKLGGGFCSPLKDNEDKLAGVEDVAGARVSDGSGLAALRCGRGAAPTGAGDENLR